MPTYPYQYTDVETDEGFELEQSIKDPALTEYNGRPVKRLISLGTGFILKGGTWARDGYERGIQNPAKEAAEAHRSEKK